MTTTTQELVARVVKADAAPMLLIASATLGGRPACRVTITIDNQDLPGLALSVDDDTTLVALTAPIQTRKLVAESIIEVSKIHLTKAAYPAEPLTRRMRQALSEPPSPDQLTERAARHALLFVLEAREPGLRRERMEHLKHLARPTNPTRATPWATLD